MLESDPFGIVTLKLSIKTGIFNNVHETLPMCRRTWKIWFIIQGKENRFFNVFYINRNAWIECS